MRNEILAATSFGVQTVSVLEKYALRDLALWLCEEEMYHDSKNRSAEPLNSESWIASCKSFEREQKANGGYCDSCRDFAGKLLSQFDLRVKV